MEDNSTFPPWFLEGSKLGFFVSSKLPVTQAVPKTAPPSATEALTIGKVPSQVWVGDPEPTMGSLLQERSEKAGPGPLFAG